MKTITGQPLKTSLVWRISDELWNHVSPLLAVEKPRKKSGRPRRDDRMLLEGLIWLCRTGEQWASLPSEFGPKSTCHARFREWVETGALARIWPMLVSECSELAGIEAPWGDLAGALRAVSGKKGPAVLRRLPESCRQGDLHSDGMA